MLGLRHQRERERASEREREGERESGRERKREGEGERAGERAEERESGRERWQWWGWRGQIKRGRERFWYKRSMFTCEKCWCGLGRVVGAVCWRRVCV